MKISSLKQVITVDQVLHNVGIFLDWMCTCGLPMGFGEFTAELPADYLQKF